MSVIENEFSKIIQNNKGDLSLKELTNLASQMNKAGYTYWINRTEKEITLQLEKPSIIQLLQRLVSKITFTHLKLTHWQKYVYRQELHYNYKQTIELNSTKQLFKKYHYTTPNWVLRAIGFPTKTYYASGVVEHG